MTEVFPRAFLDALQANSDIPAFECGGRVVSRAGLLDLVARYAGGLHAAGLDHAGVAVATGVTPEGFAVRLAAHVLGCRVVVVNTGLPPAHAAHVLADSDVLIADESVPPELLAAARKVLPLGELPAAPMPLEPRGRPEDLAVVTYTSGSTGLPKGVEFTYAAMSAYWAWQPDGWTADTRRLAERYRRYLLFGTLASAVMVEHLAFCLLGGGTAVIPDALPMFPQVLEQLRVTAVLVTVPRLHAILDELREQEVDLTSLRSLLVAGSPLPPHRLVAAYDLIGDAVHHGYGQTETGMLCLLTAEEAAAYPEAAASVGRPWTGVELEVRDEQGNPVPAGTPGEIWVRTANAFRGYRGADEGEVLRDGWVRTRDLGQVDERGYVYLAGRARDVIIVNAILHYAGPIENALTTHPDVDEAYVVAAPDERTGEAAHAFVVAVPGRSPDLDALRLAVREKLGEAAVPSTITVVESVPVAASGKPDKRALLASLDR
ncbi:acyl-CoA synthetase (AMP-forming)/AMP-acid ligase II [Amycolatopsis bartoniae]|uniref:Long-chain-fatty-acid--CoA ligase n=1 Tax=Amycolatopsis bartoniae TaxID=941986 RepID=A0A8H9J1F9_9PSEU|nr:fatty acid--CoA ligase family protein [Amycolatopsis bartoniae]MBB2937362.1 acyl-CoA synthetase (AMP-forming)/AMP-acid ligase II [Amycolatopsis bartoniae]TVT01608.1 AMP-binding protein [Amycolatopsis bartoniae]GHF78444.1 AMP-dependent synthetase [Amycolatopsis bartoniae]